RQRACTQQNREVVCALDREVTGNLARTAKDRLADLRRRNHLVVEDDRKQAANILLGGLRKTRRALIVEAEGNDRLVRPLVEGRLRVDEVFAGDDDAVLDDVRDRRLVIRHHHRRASRCAPIERLLCWHRLVHHLEGQLRRLAKYVLQALRVLKARDLYKNAVRALALNDRLGCAELVDTAVDDLDRLVDGAADAVGDAVIGEREAKQ